jgi:hypothetical protein
VVNVDVVALATSVTLTVAPGMTAPLESLTLPVILPRSSCAIAGTSKHIASTTPDNKRDLFIVSFMISPSPGLVCGLLISNAIRTLSQTESEGKEKFSQFLNVFTLMV